jgi:hypothetical protein
MSGCNAIARSNGLLIKMVDVYGIMRANLKPNSIS